LMSMALRRLAVAVTMMAATKTSATKIVIEHFLGFADSGATITFGVTMNMVYCVVRVRAGVTITLVSVVVARVRVGVTITLVSVFGASENIGGIVAMIFKGLKRATGLKDQVVRVKASFVAILVDSATSDELATIRSIPITTP